MGDQCRFGLETSRKGIRGAARKRTRFLSNAEEILDELGKKCQGNHEHVPLTDGRAREAAVYTPSLCRAICRGFIRQRMKQTSPVKRLMSVKDTDRVGELPEHEEDRDNYDMAWDDVNNKVLDPKRVKEARQEEMDHISLKQVWEMPKR